MLTNLPLSARYVAQLALSRPPGAQTFEIDGSMVFADVSGFTALSERLAEQGRAGAEELTDILNGTFTDLLTVAFAEGGDLLKYGGDALLLLFTGDHHAERACRATVGMRRALRERGAIQTGRGKVTLKVSQGIHSGSFTCFLAGGEQRELIISGRAATTVTDMETAADAGDILISPATAAHLAPSSVGATKGPGVLLKRAPGAAPVPPPTPAHPEGSPPEQFIAPAIRARIEAGVREAEHRHVTVGFVHVFGLDDLIETAGADDVLARLDRLVRATVQRASDSGVCLIATDIAGDGTKLILTAGAPDAIEDGAGNMLSVVRSVLDEIDDIGLHAGVCAGHVFAGEVGAPFRSVYTVIGDTVNLSARLMSQAGAGELYAHAPTVEQSDVQFQTEVLEPFMVKGKSRPIEAFSIGDRLGVREHVNPLDVGFVGRRHELGELDDLLATAQDGTGSCVFIAGGAGVGKSRLVGAFTERTDVVSTRLTCESFQTERAYFITRLLLRRVLGIDPREDPTVAGQQLTRVVQKIVPDDLAYLPLLGLAAGAEVPATDTVDQISPENRPDVVADVIERLLRALLDQTYILVIENSEWMDAASAAVFTRLFRRIANTPWLAVITSRGTATGLHAGLDFAARTIELTALTDDDVVELARTAFGDTAVPHHEIEEICRRSAGNPLYLLELVNARSSVGSLDEIPSSLEDIVTSRIDRLNPHDRRVLRYASILGSRFPPALARLVFESDVIDIDSSDLWDRLGEFLVTERGGDLRFTHELLRDVAYAGLPFERRRELHERVGLAIESLDQALTDDRLSALSLHFDRAGDRSRAWTYSREAATRALEKYANLEAATFLERAIEHGRVSDVAPDVSVAEAAEELGDVCSVIGQFDRSSSAYSLARTLLDDADTPRLLRKQGVVRTRSGRYRAALGWYRRALHAAETLDDEQARAFEEAELAVAYAGVRYRQGKVAECARWGRDAVELAQRGKNRRAEAHAYYLLDAALTELGDQGAVEVRELALPIFEELGDLHGQSNVLNNLGVDALQEGRWDEAADYWMQCRSVRLRAGDVVGLGDIGYNLGEMRSDQGRLEQAHDLLRDARQTFEAAGFPLGVAASLNGLGRLHGRAGDPDVGLMLLREALEIFTSLESNVWIWEVDVRIGEAYVYAGRWTEAIEHVEHVLAEHDLESAPNLQSLAFRVKGLALAGSGDRSAAVDELANASDVARSGDAMFDQALATFERSLLVDDPAEQARERSIATELFDRLGVDVTNVLAPFLRELTTA